MKIKITRRAKQVTTSVEAVASIDDLLVAILLRLPIRSLIRFKSVSKHWLAIITSPNFSIRRNPNPNPSIGLFLYTEAFGLDKKFEYVHFDTKYPVNSPLDMRKCSNYPSGIRIRQSCNGLFLCSSSSGHRRSIPTYCVYNSTTNQYTTLPKPTCGSGVSGGNTFTHGIGVLGSEPDNVHRSIRGVDLAFDPSRSPHYKVICVWGFQGSDLHQIEIYSSETGPWRLSGEPFSAFANFSQGVYWNGFVHWLGNGESPSLCYSVELEMLGAMPMPPIPSDWAEGRMVSYFGESCDRLHLIEKYGAQIQFNVYEMKRDHSGWFVKYRVDLAAVTVDFPKMIDTSCELNWYYYAYEIRSLVRGEKDDDSFLVLQIPGKIVRYNLASKTFESLCDFLVGDSLPFPPTEFIQYIESLCCV